MQITGDYGPISFFYLTKTGSKHTISSLNSIAKREIVSDDIFMPAHLTTPYSVTFFERGILHLHTMSRILQVAARVGITVNAFCL